MADPQSGAKPSKRTFQAPKGTRDFYPADMLRRRYITDAWRRAALRHGFEEIDGPTFEHLDLYTVKSGEGIVSELFSFQRAGGDDTYALRPEFTPTLARMYAARARQLPQPTKWFCIPNFFRAERPQRGRLREFYQWNVDVIGGEKPADGDSEVVACNLGLLDAVGLTPEVACARVSHRGTVEDAAKKVGIASEKYEAVLTLLDSRKKLTDAQAVELIRRLGLTVDQAKAIEDHFRVISNAAAEERDRGVFGEDRFADLTDFLNSLSANGWRQWWRIDPYIVRGLAYYTGMVFEVIAEGERAVAGGGRYDKLIELFGGPSTPACGFGMGDVVLGNLLEDRGLIPEGRELLEALSRPMPLRPDVFVISSGKEGADDALVPLVATLRRGVESERYVQSQSSDDPAKRMKPWDAARYDVPPLHARRSYKATKNVGKLLGEAGACHARFAAILESGETCTLKNLDTGEQREIAIADLGRRVATSAPTA